MLAVTAAFAMTLAGDAGAQSLLEFDRWMQKIERHSLAIQRHLKRSEGEQAIAEARGIRELYTKMAEYFVRRGDSLRAERISRTGVDLAGQIIESTGNLDFTAAQRAASSLAKDCRECHSEYKPLD
jgi:hypothetical protein